MRAVNLLPKDVAQHAKKPRNTPAVISTALIVLVSGLLGVLYFNAKSTVAMKEIELADATAELQLLPSPTELAAKTAGQRQLAGEQEARVTALTAALKHRVAWDRVLREISLVLPEDVWLTEMSATSPTPPGAAPVVVVPGAAPDGLMIIGYTYSHEAVARLITRLSVLPSLSNVWLERSLRTVAGRPLVSFTIKAGVRAPGATS